MRQYILINGNEEFIFLEIGKNKYKEEYWKKEINEDGDTEWKLYHEVKFLTEESMKDLANQLIDAGFRLI